MTSVTCPLAASGMGDAASVAVTVNVNVPDVSGVPKRSPYESTPTPSGRDPDVSDQV